MIQMQQRPGEARPDWLRQPPVEWERRLREISPVLPFTSHLRFRWRSDLCEATGEPENTWVLYECTPLSVLQTNIAGRDRIAQLQEHWSTLPTHQQFGRRRSVSEYQFYMFLTHQVEVRLFWVLQGSQTIQGGTPYSFTDRERRILDAAGESAEPIPIGILPNIPFDERVVTAILARDRLLAHEHSITAMQAAASPEAQRRAEAETELAHRKAFLDWHHTQNAPCADFLSFFYRTKAARDLPPAPKGAAAAAMNFREHFLEHGVGMRTSQVTNRALHVAVK